MSNKRKSYGVNIGSSSILLIFVILCLVSFAVLSIVSAQTDYKLSCKLAERTTKYYEANNEVESYLRDLQASLEKIYEDSATADEYFAVAGHDTTFSIQLSEQQMLNVHLTILYPDDGKGYYEINTWKVETQDTLELDDTLPVFTDMPF